MTYKKNSMEKDLKNNMGNDLENNVENNLENNKDNVMKTNIWKRIINLTIKQALLLILAFIIFVAIASSMLLLLACIRHRVKLPKTQVIFLAIGMYVFAFVFGCILRAFHDSLPEYSPEINSL